MVKKIKYVLITTILLLASCHSVKKDEHRTVFRYNESAGITSLDPAYAKDQANIWACNQIFNGLVQLDSQMNILPCLAHSWELSKDGLTYTFHLRNDVYFQETDFFSFGPSPRKMIASDVAYSFNRIVNAEVASPGAWIFNYVDTDKNGKKSFNVINDSTFSICLKSPFPPFLGLLCMQYCSVVPKEVVEKFGKDFRKFPVGTGPFQMKIWKEGVKLVCVKNPHYFEFDENGKRLPCLDAVSVSFIVDKQSVFMEFVKGNLDFMSGLDASYKDELLTKDGNLNSKYSDRIKLLKMPYLNTEYLGFLIDSTQQNVKDNPLMIKEIRQAINYSFDRKKMLRHLRSNIGEAGTRGIIPPCLLKNDINLDIGYDYNPKMVKKLLETAAYPDGKGLPVIKLYVSESYMDIMEYIAHEAEQFGIRIKVLKIQAAMLRQFISQSEVPFFRGSWIADYPDAENYLSLFYSPNFCPNGPNYTHYKNKTLDRLYEDSQNCTDDSLRKLIYLRMDKIIMDDAPVVVLYYDYVLRFIRNDVENMENNAMNLLNLKRVRKRI